ncbi:MAG: hypothetical protein APR54_07045 [Candidatus Cloacimonas sp. SDB]|nr:MAG: hypothetical protein APR54_07045 [Candidatus Cloacimonas sp. SDB]
MTYFTHQNNIFKRPIVAMGTFDGVHLGHQKLIQRLVQKAEKLSGEAVIITYFHHPLETIHKKTFPYLLTERAKKEKLLKNLGVDFVLYLKFNQKIAKMSPEEFLDEIILKEIKTTSLVVGYDTHFGKDRSGDHKFLQSFAQENELEIELIPPLKIGNRIVSSSIIRDYVREGNMIEVKKYLGRNYTLAGLVRKGHKLGTGLGFPTLNINPADQNKLIPALGVYLCEILIEEQRYFGLTNVGYSPTLKKTGILEVETHILDFAGDLYNEEVEIIFHRKLREELHFESRNDLIDAIKADIKAARKYFNLKGNDYVLL